MCEGKTRDLRDESRRRERPSRFFWLCSLARWVRPWLSCGCLAIRCHFLSGEVTRRRRRAVCGETVYAGHWALALGTTNDEAVEATARAEMALRKHFGWGKRPIKSLGLGLNKSLAAQKEHEYQQRQEERSGWNQVTDKQEDLCLPLVNLRPFAPRCSAFLSPAGAAAVDRKLEGCCSPLPFGG